MPIRYFHAESLGGLFPVLYDEVRRERRTLPPQKTQAIIVGNLETEAWITRSFLAADTVLMGVDFPFLESAIRSFSERLRLQLHPESNESWFLPPAGGLPRALGIAEFEMLLLHIITHEEGAHLLAGLGYDRAQLTASQFTTLAAILADELRETILHRPTLLRDIAAGKQHSQSAGAQLWCTLYRAMQATQRPFPAFDPELAEQILAQQIPAGTASETLHLFGMPMLSEYHLRIIAAIGHHMSVNLYMTDLSAFAGSNNALLATAGRKSAEFSALLRGICESYSTGLSVTGITKDKRQGAVFSLYALPGIWRGAELIGDEFHSLLTSNAALYQDDIGVSLTNPELQYAAFERALAMRQLAAFSRERFYEIPHPLAELWQIVADIVQGGLNRPRLIRYAHHPIVARTTAAEPEKVAQWLGALEKAQGYRDDYPDAQAVFNLEAALRRIDRGTLIHYLHGEDLPAARTLRLFDSKDFAAGFRAFFKPLLSARTRLSGLTGQELADTMLALQHEISGPGESTQLLAQWFEQMRELEGFAGLTLPQVVKFLKRHLPGKSLAQQTDHEGITFSSLAATCFTRDTQLLFDLNEDADQQDRQVQYLFPELASAPTRYSGIEQLASRLATALCSDTRHLIVAYSAQDPASGAEKYPSQVLADLPGAAKEIGRAERLTRSFPATLQQHDSSLPPVASDADRRTAWLLQNPSRNPQPLSVHILPDLATETSQQHTDLHELIGYLRNPAYQVLRRHLPPELAIAEFSRDEPKLAVSNDARLRFCEEYLELLLLDAVGKTQPTASDFVRYKQARGDYPPEGFDQAGRLLAEGNNDSRLSALAIKLRDDFTLVEYLFHAGVKKSFAVEETARLTRHYLPAIRLHETHITGSSGTLLQNSDGRLFRLQSAIYGERNAQLVELYLLLCLFTLGDVELNNREITLADLATANSSQDPIGAIRFTARSGLPLPDAAAATEYLELLLTRLRGQHIALYDHAMIRSPRLSQWADLPAEQVLNRLEKYMEAEPKHEARFLQQYYGLKVDSGSVKFFEEFIRPVALLDREENPTEKQTDTSSGKTSRKKTAKT